MATTTPTVSAQMGSLTEDIASSSYIQLGSSSTTYKLSFVNATLTAGGWLQVGTSSSFTYAGKYGKATLDTVTGKVTYALDNSLASTNALAGGALVKDTFTVPETLAGVKYSTAVSFNITGTNDAAVITGSSTATLNESNSAQTATGNLFVTDVDSAATFVPQTNIAGSSGYGSFTINSSGSWIYTMNSAHDEFKAGSVYNDSFTVKSADGTSKVVTVTITGTNDNATISGAAAGTVTEDSLVKASGTLTVSDVDTGESKLQTPASLVGTYGTFTLNTTTGAWDYTVDSTKASVQALGAGATATDTLTVKSSDGTATQAITVTINGANDNATISGTAAGTVTEDSLVKASGTLTVSDVDAGQAVLQTPASLVGTYGTFTLNTSTGAWDYTVDSTKPSVQALGAGATATDTLTVKSSDGTATQAITVTISGANDNATISGTAAGTVTEDSLVKASGTLTVS
ncbi:MAG: toxin, partial [Betaproteobacteria bacterium]|nr:toxin [Betaproteobacteria bacterium]